MDPDRWQQVERLYLAALEMTSDHRAAFLEVACAADSALRREIESLLSFALAADSFLEAAVQEVASQASGAGTTAESGPLGTTGSDPPKLGRYQLIEKIGKGGMGVVYRAMDPAIGRTVAIKTIIPTYAGGDSQLRARLLRESQAAGRLSHPNIVAVHDICHEDQSSYIVMEYVQGRTLDQVMREDSSLPGGEALRIVQDCAAALDYAHSRGVVHRDVKPANIMLQPDGMVKIADFGIAKLSQSATLTQKATAVGSPYYMAPEQWRGESVTEQVDQYALATVAYLMLTGRRPFEGDSLATLATKTLYQEAPAALTFNSQLNPMVDVVLRKALAKSGDARFPTCTEFALALRRAFEGVSNAAPPGARRAGNKTVVALVTALLAILSIAGWFIYQGRAGTDAKAVEVARNPPSPSIEPATQPQSQPKKPKVTPKQTTSPPVGPSEAAEIRGEALLKQGSLAEAVPYFTQAIAAKPDYRAYFGRASAYRQLGQMENAVADYSRAIPLKPDSAAAYHDRAICEMRLGLDKNAADDYDQALKLDPTNPRTWNGRGAIYLKKGGYNKARDCFTRAIELDANFVEAYQNRARAETKLNDTAAAEEDLKKATALQQEKLK